MLQGGARPLPLFPFLDDPGQVFWPSADDAGPILRSPLRPPGLAGVVSRSAFGTRALVISDDLHVNPANDFLTSCCSPTGALSSSLCVHGLLIRSRPFPPLDPAGPHLRLP